MLGFVLVMTLAQSSAPAPAQPVRAQVAVLGETQLLDIRAVSQFQPSPDNGCWMDSPTCQGVAKALIEKRSLTEQLAIAKATPPPSAKWPWIVGALVVGAAAGAGAVLAAK